MDTAAAFGYCDFSWHVTLIHSKSLEFFPWPPDNAVQF